MCSGGKTPDVGSRGFKDVMLENELKAQERDVSYCLEKSEYPLAYTLALMNNSINLNKIVSLAS